MLMTALASTLNIIFTFTRPVNLTCRVCSLCSLAIRSAALKLWGILTVPFVALAAVVLVTQDEFLCLSPDLSLRLHGVYASTSTPPPPCLIVGTTSHTGFNHMNGPGNWFRVSLECLR